MPTLPTFDEIYAVGRTEVQARNGGLTDWRSGSALDAVVGGGAVVADQVIRAGVAQFARQFVDTAEGADLDALALDRFQLARRAASQAVGQLTWTDSSGTSRTIPLGTRVRGAVNGVTVTVETTISATLPAYGVAVAAARVQTAGPTGNVAAAVLTSIVDGVGAGAVVTNVDRFTGGVDVETDATFRDRIRRYFQTLRKGTVAALRAGALSVPGVAFATVDEQYTPTELGGYTAIYVGDRDGWANPTLALLVAVEIENWRAAGVEVRVLAAVREEVTLDVAIACDVGADQLELRAAVIAGIVAAAGSLASGQTLYASNVLAACHRASAAVRGAAVLGYQQDRQASAPQNAIRVVETGITLTLYEVNE